MEDLAKKKTSPANIAVLRKLEGSGTLFAKHKYTHSYPHCWRSKTPIIFRRSTQWFVSLDKAGSRTERWAHLQIAEKGGWIPAWGEARIRGAVESRPTGAWSRSQRSWGVPIPAFYDAEKNPFLDAGVIRAIAGQGGEPRHEPLVRRHSRGDPERRDPAEGMAGGPPR